MVAHPGCSALFTGLIVVTLQAACCPSSYCAAQHPASRTLELQASSVVDAKCFIGAKCSSGGRMLPGQRCCCEGASALSTRSTASVSLYASYFPVR